MVAPALRPSATGTVKPPSKRRCSCSSAARGLPLLWYPQLVRQFVIEGLVRLGVSASLWRDVLLGELAVIAAEADHAGFAREHLLLFRHLSGGTT